MDGAGQVAKTGAQGSASSPAWQALNVVKVQMCDNKKGEKVGKILKRTENRQGP